MNLQVNTVTLHPNFLSHQARVARMFAGLFGRSFLSFKLLPLHLLPCMMLGI